MNGGEIVEKKRQRIKGARKTKGRFISGHADQIESRTFQETRHLESVDRVMRKWRAEPPKPDHPRPEVAHLLSHLRKAVSGVDNRLPDRGSSNRERRPRPEPTAPKGQETEVERSWGGWVYTIRWPSGEIVGKRKEV